MIFTFRIVLASQRLFTGSQHWWRRTEEWTDAVGETQAANKQASGAGPMGARETVGQAGMQEHQAGGELR
jgi:hypothetical protein